MKITDTCSHSIIRPLSCHPQWIVRLSECANDAQAITPALTRMPDNTEVIVRSLYKATRDFYGDRFRALGAAACGFRILYGPPTVGAPILFIGYQPGGLASEIEDHHFWTWPDTCDYAVREWKLAKVMRTIWSVDFLSRCTGFNSIFFRSPSAAEWTKVPLALRREMEGFCYSEMRKLVETLAPKLVVFIGFDSFDRFAEERSDALIMDGRVLIKAGSLWGIPANGVIHLSGAQIRRDHMEGIKKFFGRLA